MRAYGSYDRSKWELTVVVSLPSGSVHVLAVEGDNRLHHVDALHVVDEEVLLLWLRALSIYGSVRLLVGAPPKVFPCLQNFIYFAYDMVPFFVEGSFLLWVGTPLVRRTPE